MSVLLPAITDHVGASILEAAEGMVASEATNLVDFAHPMQAFPATSGERVAQDQLRDLREALLDVAAKHGLLLVSMTALGATAMSPRLEESMIAFVEERMHFLRPVFVDDNIRSVFTVADITPEPERKRGRVRFDIQLVNQDERTVVEGEHHYLLRSRS